MIIIRYMVSTLPEILAHHAETIPDQLFTRIIKGGVEVKSRTFLEAWRWATQWAALFAEHGLGRGDAVVLALSNTDAFVGAYYGALIAGCAPAPLAPMRRITEDDPYLNTVIERVKFINAKVLVVPSGQSAICNLQTQIPAAVLTESHIDPACTLNSPRSTFDDIALIQFTSGTLGDPKAVLLTQRALVAQVEWLRDWLVLFDRFRERGVSWLPLFHDMGLIGFLLTPGYAGGEVNLLQPEDFILRPALWLKAITDYKATVTGAPPSAYALCVKRVKDSDVGQYDLSSVRAALIGAERVTRESVTAFCDKFRAAGLRASALMPTYGLAENALAVTMPPLEAEPEFDAVDGRALAEGIARPIGDGDPAHIRWFASVGEPLPGVTLRIVNDAGNDLPERRVGEIIIKSPSVMSGYHGSNEIAIRAGWLYTGDLGYLAGGNLHVTGRKKEVIIAGGRNYYPDDVEQVMNGVPGVRMDRVVAIGVQDIERSTEMLVVLAETDRADEAERDALRMNMRQALLAAGYPIGKVVLLKPKSIQSTLTGKLKRSDCRARYLAGEFPER